VLFAATKSKAELAAERRTRKLERRKITPGSVLLKYFHNIASGDVYALFPNARVLMSNVDKFVLGVPAIATGIPILINLYTTITVLFLVLGFYLGVTASVQDSDMKRRWPRSAAWSLWAASLRRNGCAISASRSNIASS
jgi:Protein of unknown function (DUF3754)